MSDNGVKVSHLCTQFKRGHSGWKGWHIRSFPVSVRKIRDAF